MLDALLAQAGAALLTPAGWAPFARGPESLPLKCCRHGPHHHGAILAITRPRSTPEDGPACQKAVLKLSGSTTLSQLQYSIRNASAKSRIQYAR